MAFALVERSRANSMAEPSNDDDSAWAWNQTRGWFRLDENAPSSSNEANQADGRDTWYGHDTGGWRWDSSNWWNHAGWNDWHGYGWQNDDWQWYDNSWWSAGRDDRNYYQDHQDDWWHGDSSKGEDAVGHSTDGCEPSRHGRRASIETTLPSVSDEREESVRQVNEEMTSQSGQSQGGKPREPKTGKEVIPAYDGVGPLRDYRRRIDLFLATTGIDPPFRAGRLVEQLSGSAWKATSTLDVARLKAVDGVDYLVNHLQAELEPIEHLRVFNTLTGFYKQFRRSRGEEFISFDTNFRAQLQKLEEINAPLMGITKSYWFLETAGLSSELRKQVVSAAGGSYEYEKLRSALMAIVPSVKRDDRLIVMKTALEVINNRMARTRPTMATNMGKVAESTR